MIQFWTALVKLITAILSVMSGWFAGRAAGRQAAKIEELQSYVDTTKRMDAVGHMSDAHAAFKWLKERGRQ